MGPELPREEAFDKDYLYFYEQLLTPERTAAEVELVWKLLELEPGLELLDLACGHGRIANSLAEGGVRVTGLDATPLFLDLARKDAAERGVEVEYVEGDMRALPWSERFDRVLCWFTSFGYFSDEENRQVLLDVHRALKPGGLFAVEMNHRDNLFGRWEPESVTERGEDRMIDRRAFDPQTGRSRDERTIIRGGKTRTFKFSVRMFGAAELKDWLRAAGFRDAFAYGEDGEPLTLEHRRMTVVGRRAAPVREADRGKGSGETGRFPQGTAMIREADRGKGLGKPGGFPRAPRSAPANDRRRPDAEVTRSAQSRHPPVTICSLGSQWGGGRRYRIYGTPRACSSV